MECSTVFGAAKATWRSPADTKELEIPPSIGSNNQALPKLPISLYRQTGNVRHNIKIKRKHKIAIKKNDYFVFN